ncbi:hypothetical protein SAMN06297251_1102 [Fulvimarina manganoxydans]|uniref:Uncharacterized protein n=1 Tax=Fulvimarina manganoxydans TaxID=937218 RepID=A0A1W2CHL9_9HYPH|nr:hypothetical protein SAMN06297251_1102 [Fulvimarina manganoxydans]
MAFIARVILGPRTYDIHTSCEKLLFQGFATDSGLDDDLGDLSQLPAASTDDFSPWGRATVFPVKRFAMVFCPL